MEHKIGEFNLLNDAEFNCLLQKVKQEIREMLIDATGYSMSVKGVSEHLQNPYPEWFVDYACKSLVADKLIREYIGYSALETDWDADLAQWQDGKKLENNNFTLGEK